MLTKYSCLSSIAAHYLFPIQCCVPVRCCALSQLAGLHRPHTRLSSRHTGCVFRSKIPSVQLPSVCKYTYRLMTIAHSLCTRGLITLASLFVSLGPLWTESTALPDQYFLPAFLSYCVHVPHTRLSSLVKLFYLGEKTQQKSSNLASFFFSHPQISPHGGGGTADGTNLSSRCVLHIFSQ